MSLMERAQQVRSHIGQLLGQLSGSDGAPHETILVRQGYYCGHRIELAGWQAAWFVEENRVKFFDANGGLAAVYDVDDLPTRVSSRAA